MPELTPETKVHLMRTMLRIRLFEEKVVELYPAQDMRTPVHLYIGQEAIADVTCKTGGVGAEIACRVVENAPEFLQAPVRRINFADTPTPCSPVLEDAYYPGSKSIKETIRRLGRI